LSALDLLGDWFNYLQIDIAVLLFALVLLILLFVYIVPQHKTFSNQ